MIRLLLFTIIIVLVNPSFEDGQDRLTPTDVYDAGGRFLEQRIISEINTPNGWTVFFREGLPVPWDDKNDVGFAQPEVNVIPRLPPYVDPPRVFDGVWALQMFTFYMIHDAGVYQQVEVQPWSTWQLSAYTHAWASVLDDPHQSYVTDCEQVTQMAGIDPTGGTDPYADTVIWSEAAHIYDEYAQTPVVKATAISDTMTVFLRSVIKWPIKHNDVYWDAVRLEQIAAPVFLPVIYQ